MPIPKVGDVIELHDQPFTGDDWSKLLTEKFWVVIDNMPHRHADYIRLRLRGLFSGYIPERMNTNAVYRKFWPLEEKEITINEFLSAANHAILNTTKENQPDEPASK